MNLHGIVAPAIGAINPLISVGIQISVGQGPTGVNGFRPTLYATPGALTASIAGTVLTVSGISAGVLQPGQTLADAGALLPGTMITGQLSGAPGGPGTYSVNQSQTVGSEAMTTSMNLQGQIQPIAWRDLQQLDGLNLGGVRWKAYLYGEVDAIVRPENKGGDLITIPPPNRHAGTWLVALVLEQFPDWVCCAIVLQDGS